jgi:hypothetical protein
MNTMTGTDMLITAVEGGINYWAAVEDYDPDGRKRFATVTTFDEETTHTVTAGDMSAAAKKVLTLYPNSVAACDIRSDNIDAGAADLIFQVACFGKGVYA